MSNSLVIRVYKVEGETKDGKKFTAWETTDTADKIRTTVTFVQDGKQPPKENCKIEILDGWLDSRKRYPIIRVKDYNVVGDLTKRKDTLSGFIVSVQDEEEPKAKKGKKPLKETIDESPFND